MILENALFQNYEKGFLKTDTTYWGSSYQEKLKITLNSVLSIVADKNRAVHIVYAQHWKDIEGIISDRQ